MLIVRDLTFILHIVYYIRMMHRNQSGEVVDLIVVIPMNDIILEKVLPHPLVTVLIFTMKENQIQLHIFQDTHNSRVIFSIYTRHDHTFDFTPSVCNHS